jgi:hypothetical protein
MRVLADASRWMDPKGAEAHGRHAAQGQWRPRGHHAGQNASKAILPARKGSATIPLQRPPFFDPEGAAEMVAGRRFNPAPAIWKALQMRTFF